MICFFTHKLNYFIVCNSVKALLFNGSANYRVYIYVLYNDFTLLAS